MSCCIVFVTCCFQHAPKCFYAKFVEFEENSLKNSVVLGACSNNFWIQWFRRTETMLIHKICHLCVMATANAADPIPLTQQLLGCGSGA